MFWESRTQLRRRCVCVWGGLVGVDGGGSECVVLYERRVWSVDERALYSIRKWVVSEREAGEQRRIVAL